MILTELSYPNEPKAKIFYGAKQINVYDTWRPILNYLHVCHIFTFELPRVVPEKASKKELELIFKHLCR